MRHLCGRSFSRENEENRWKSKNKKQKDTNIYKYFTIMLIMIQSRFFPQTS